MAQPVSEALAPTGQQVTDVAVDHVPSKTNVGGSGTPFPRPSSEVELVHLSRAIRVRQFQTKLGEATVFDGAESEGKVKQVLRDQSFDYAPVQDKGQLGYIAEADLEGSCPEDRFADPPLGGPVMFHDPTVQLTVTTPTLCRW